MTLRSFSLSDRNILEVKCSTRMCLYVGKPVHSNDTSIVEARDEGSRCPKGMSRHHPGACGNHQRGNRGDSERSLEIGLPPKGIRRLSLHNVTAYLGSLSVHITGSSTKSRNELFESEDALR